MFFKNVNCVQFLSKFDQNTTNHVKKNIQATVDRGYKGKDRIAGNDIVFPNSKKKESYYLKKQRQARCRSRAGNEGLISHLKPDHRMLRNYLQGTEEDQINTLMATTAYKMMKWMRLKRKEILFFLFWRYSRTFIFSPVNIVAIL